MIGCNVLVVFTVLPKLLSRRRLRRKTRVGESEEQSLGPDEDEDEYNSGEYPIRYVTRRRGQDIRRTSMSTIGSQLTSVGETQTYSLGSILNSVRNSNLETGSYSQGATTNVTGRGDLDPENI